MSLSSYGRGLQYSMECTALQQSCCDLTIFPSSTNSSFDERTMHCLLMHDQLISKNSFSSFVIAIIQYGKEIVFPFLWGLYLQNIYQLFLNEKINVQG